MSHLRGKSPILTMLLIGLVCIVLLFALAAAASAFGFIKQGDPAPNTLGKAGTVQCSAWGNAPDQYQTLITGAANKVGMQPALLGAVFLSEHGDAWPKTPINGPWAQGGKGKGPFQIENWDGFWKQVIAQGYNGGKSLSESDPNNFEDSSIASAVSLIVGMKAKDIPVNTTEQKYVMYVGMYHNRGSSAAYKWAEDEYNLNNPPENKTNPGWEWGANDYAHRTWRHFQDLHNGCTQYASAGGTELGLRIKASAFEELKDCDGKGADACSPKYSGGQKEPKWCSNFATWVYKKNIKDFGNQINMASAFATEFSKKDSPHQYIASPTKVDQGDIGDVLFFKSGDRISHVEIIVARGINEFETIGGNTNNTVLKTKRPLKNGNMTIAGIGKW